MGHTTETSIEIAAPPVTLLDFDKYKEWHQVFTITRHYYWIRRMDIEKGDRLIVDIKGFGAKFEQLAVVQENSPECLRWRFKVPIIFSLEHDFYFHHSKVTPGGTTMVQKEVFGGLLFTGGPSKLFSKKTADASEILANDLKDESERREAAGAF